MNLKERVRKTLDKIGDARKDMYNAFPVVADAILLAKTDTDRDTLKTVRDAMEEAHTLWGEAQGALEQYYKEL